jgi:uncharacterized membrane protein
MIIESEIGNYLTTLRSHLGRLTLDEREEIIREIEAHIRDSAEEAGGDSAAVLARLGPASELAAQYRDGLLVRQASRSYSPPVLLRASLRLATKGITGVAIFLLGIFGYAIGGAMVMAALIKPFQPANTGVWFTESHTLESGVLQTPPPSSAHELLGWWIIPVMLAVGALTLLATTFAIRQFLSVSQQLTARLRA